MLELKMDKKIFKILCSKFLLASPMEMLHSVFQKLLPYVIKGPRQVELVDKKIF